jgi:hypothetical protein
VPRCRHLGEFLEAALLRDYRRRQVPMLELRDFIDKIRDQYGVPYPLADRRPYVGGRHLLSEAQDVTGLGADFCLIAVVRDQLDEAGPFIYNATRTGGLNPYRSTERPPAIAASEGTLRSAVSPGSRP